MSLLSKISLLVHAEAEAAADKQLSQHSIPVLTEEIRNIETSLAAAKHQAAVAAATITTLTERHDNLQSTIDTDTQRVAAWLAQGKQDEARTVGQRVVFNKADLAALDTQITNAKTASAKMDSAVSTFQTKHDALVAQLRTLRSEDGNARAVEGMTKSLQQVQEMTNSVDPNSLENAVESVHQHNNEAQEEFNRTVNSPSFKVEVDPLQNSSVDDLLKSLAPSQAAAASVGN